MFFEPSFLVEKIRNMDVDFAIILEDDTVLIPSVDFRALFGLLREVGVDVIRLATQRIERSRTLAHFQPIGVYLCRVTYPRYGLGTGCYAITPQAAGALYAGASNIDVPVDHWLERYRNHRIPIYNLFPAPGIEIGAQPTIFRPTNQQSQGLSSYALARAELALVDGLDEWRLLRLDNILRKRIDRLSPGMAVWPHSELRRRLRRLLRPPLKLPE